MYSHIGTENRFFEMGLGLGKSYICLNFISSVCFISKIKKIKTIKGNICQTIRIVCFSFLMLEVVMDADVRFYWK